MVEKEHITGKRCNKTIDRIIISRGTLLQHWYVANILHTEESPSGVFCNYFWILQLQGEDQRPMHVNFFSSWRESEIFDDSVIIHEQ